MLPRNATLLTSLTLLISLTTASVLIAPAVHAAPTKQTKSTQATPAQKEIKIKAPEGAMTAEEKDRVVDRAALDAQSYAIKGTQALLKRYRGNEREANLLARLAEMYYQNGQIHFRLAHEIASRNQSPIDLKEYKVVLKEGISTLDTLIRKYPKFEQIQLAYYMRGRSYEDIEDKKRARSDYLHLVTHFPEARETISAYMSLAQFAIDDDKHEEAVKYLGFIESQPKSEHYPYALFKLGWSHFNLRHYKKSLDYLEKHVRFYDEKAAREDGLSSSDFSLRENSLLDYALFHFNYNEIDISDFNPTQTLNTFRRLDQGSTLGRMNLRFAKLLRSHNHTSQLTSWKNHILRNELTKPETLDILNTVFEYQRNKRLYKDLVSTSKDMVTWYTANQGKHLNHEGYPEAQNLLLDTAKELRTVTLKNKSHQNVSSVARPLAAIYTAFTEIVSSQDERVPGVHYNLAETLFEIKDYPQSTEHYLWVLNHWNEKSGLNKREVTLRSISSRYQELRGASTIPNQLAAVSLERNLPKPLPQKLSDWISWMDDFVESYDVSNDDEFNNFVFEANRALYHHGHIQDSIKRLIAFVKTRPESKFAVPSASLVLDSLVATKDWVKTHALANQFRNIKEWKKNPFSSTLFTLAADAYYKQVEASSLEGDDSGALRKVDEFVKKYSGSKRLEDVLLLAGQTAVKKKDDRAAIDYFSRLIKEFPESQNIGAALISRANLHMKTYDFLAANNDYRQILTIRKNIKMGLSEPEINGFRRKILFHNFLVENHKALLLDLKNSDICTPELNQVCLQYEAVLQVKDHNSEQLKSAFQKSIKADKDLRPIWATLALEDQEALQFPDRMLLVRVLMGRWDNLDPMIQFTLLPYLEKSVPLAFENNRKDMAKFAKLKPTEKAISHRVRLMQEMENTATRVMNLPWASVKATVLNEIAQIYIDFSEELTHTPLGGDATEQDIAQFKETVQKITLPFEEKGQEIRRRAFELASNAAIAEKPLEKITDRFFKDNPSQAQSLRGQINLAFKQKIDLDSIRDFDRDNNWSSPSEVQKRWKQAIQSRSWPQALYFISEAREKKLLPDYSLTLMKAVTLFEAGARSESLQEIELNLHQFPVMTRLKLEHHLLRSYLSSLGRGQVKRWIESQSKTLKAQNIREQIFDTDHAFWLAYGADWSQANLHAPIQRELLREARNASQSAFRNWALEKNPQKEQVALGDAKK